ncbi:MAG TPA: PDZ domain-containing protein [Pyrinomonadaceae bacterium]|jgi:S1-C subfamily serine protease|nr:PDZ domain-containing protein [Pyrinomonadaceae bacterium]
MGTEAQRAQKETAATADAQPELCPSCGAALVDGMRFCRMCGYRLGEGMAEYVETVRFDRMAGMSGLPQGDQAMTGAAGAQTTLITQPPMAPAAPTWKPKRGKKWTWMFLLIAFMLVLIVGGQFAFRAIRDAARAGVARLQPPPEPPHSFVGVSEFSDTEGNAGALLEEALPGSPAEQAKLMDGDIITKFDGKAINDEDSLREAISETPIGKTVEVVYLRDGETQTTQLTTMSNKDYDLDVHMPRERGLLGIDDTERVAVAGTKLHGVRVGEVYDNRPADLAGLQEGDIVTEFDGKPVRTAEGLGGYIALAKPASTIKLIVYREGQRIEIPVKMGRRN